MQSPEKEPEDAAEETSLGQSKCKNSSKNKKQKQDKKKPNPPRTKQDRG